MRRIIILAALSFMLGGCVKDGKETPVLLHSYIINYIDGPVVMFGERPWAKNQLELRFEGMIDLEYELYAAPEVSDLNNDEFLKIAERNGDRSYNRKDVFSSYLNRVSCADNFKSMQVLCTNLAWDGGHPAGTSLNDLMTIQYASYAEYIHNGYPKGEEGLKGYNKPLSELSEDDLTMIDTSIDIFFRDPPSAPGSYEMEVRLVTTDGEEKTAVCMLELE